MVFVRTGDARVAHHVITLMPRHLPVVKQAKELIVPPFDPSIHHRRSIRLKEYDYAQAGAYFVTINTYERQPFFGVVGTEGITLNEFGMIAAECWEAIPDHYQMVELDAFVVMPNHVHGIVVINGGGTTAEWATHASPVQTEGVRGAKPSSLGSIIGQFKSASSRQINALRGANQTAGLASELLRTRHP